MGRSRFLLLLVLATSCEGVLPVQPKAPDGAVRPTGYVQHLTPPAGYSTANGWLQIATLRRSGGAGTVEVDYMRLYARVNGHDVVLSADEYNGTTGCGATSARFAWGTDEREPLPATYPGSSMIVEPGSQPSRVFHPWICRYPRATIPAGAERVWMEARVWVTGEAAVQGGLDYWANPTSGPHVEAGATDWYLAADGWQTLTLARP